jgi:hypothetical protein
MDRRVMAHKFQEFVRKNMQNLFVQSAPFKCDCSVTVCVCVCVCVRACDISKVWPGTGHEVPERE